MTEENPKTEKIITIPANMRPKGLVKTLHDEKEATRKRSMNAEESVVTVRDEPKGNGYKLHLLKLYRHDR